MKKLDEWGQNDPLPVSIPPKQRSFRGPKVLAFPHKNNTIQRISGRGDLSYSSPENLRPSFLRRNRISVKKEWITTPFLLGSATVGSFRQFANQGGYELWLQTICFVHGTSSGDERPSGSRCVAISDCRCDNGTLKPRWFRRCQESAPCSVWSQCLHILDSPLCLS